MTSLAYPVRYGPIVDIGFTLLDHLSGQALFVSLISGLASDHSRTFTYCIERSPYSRDICASLSCQLRARSLNFTPLYRCAPVELTGAMPPREEYSASSIKTNLRSVEHAALFASGSAAVGNTTGTGGSLEIHLLMCM